MMPNRRTLRPNSHAASDQGYNGGMDLFDEQRRDALRSSEPLPARMRPISLDEFAGQEEILGQGKVLRRLIESDRLTSAIFYGPPGCGKTALAGIIARMTRAEFESLHAAAAGVKDVRAVIERARERLVSTGRRTVLFLDEIHRFNRGQQDALLSDVENGVLILIGATTENPFFSVNSPLISRGTVFRFTPLTVEQITALCHRALQDPDRGLGRLKVTCAPEALKLIAETCEGDARRALGGLEIAMYVSARSQDEPVHITLDAAAQAMQQRTLSYDKSGDLHYDVTSAFIKSMRGSDPDASVYWLARMLESGEDPLFIARRIAICASEDVGNADPRAMVLAASAVQIVQFVGLPECELALAQAAIYIACSPKSNAVTLAIAQARSDVRNRPTLNVPSHLRDSHCRGAARLGHGVGYRYPHDDPSGVVDQDYLGAERVYYHPTDRGEERRIGEYLDQFRRRRSTATVSQA